ncbi:Histidine kinase [Lentibacillus sp. JNUCC-1]|uniref:sensor histidine kinase n=1 Tax=Lentibacillus sp. JNUCC-1 TaxID=2654513 RepID=UPI0012E7350B|nr:sensor histidine kinase [Lentibacillus sp. JNUCC-1]MUV39048.1 Histidine kinase [Lentibacillus sp. JNUCC-1]
MVELTKEGILDKVIEEMVEVVESSKDEIFTIGDNARAEYERLVNELEDTKDKVVGLIDDGDDLEKKVRLSRQNLSRVSKHFDQYSENEIRDVYERTHELQTRLAMMRQAEASLRQKRDELERRLQTLYGTIERAETLTRKISVILKYLTDDFQQMNMMLEEAKEKQEFGLKIIEAQEDERRKISREIHDGPAQMLANVLLRSEIVDRTFRSGNLEESLNEIKSMRKMIRSSLYEVRRVIYDLRPMALDDLGLLPTMRKYVDTMAEYNDIEIELTTMGKQERLPQKYEVAFFRLAQEALQNAIKHSAASLIQIKLEINNRFMFLVVKDNGKGFDPNQKKEESFGLIGMRERIDMLEGSFTIESAKGKGTSLIIKVPL